MSNALDKRLSRLESLASSRLGISKICNCRTATSFHSANCLKAILQGASRVCPTHGFRDFGFFMFAARWATLKREDNQFCPCPEDPWRSFVLNGPRTWEAHNAAREACRQRESEQELTSPPRDLAEENAALDLVIGEYEHSKQRWMEETGRQLPNRDEILAMHQKRARERRTKS
jgi:hypothetical protein